MAQFARTWRPRRFEDVVGQELTVSLLRNSLFRNHIFPVYLFAGQRGCGKTTLARIFAAAINCEQRTQFMLQPHAIAIPCHQCTSCKAMHDGSHTDFHEIDAASHTGVDHVRAILEATTLTPHLGTKRIYLIDEVHMLSRAACNALLKTLEEPLETVVFLLATTDPHKIIDTVRSRCFQLFLHAHTPDTITKQLIRICSEEHIPYDPQGLTLIAKASEGSLRDAINILERVVIAYNRVHCEEVPSLIGMLTLDNIIDIIEACAQHNAPRAIELARHPAITLAGIQHAWGMLYELFRLCIAHYCGIHQPDTDPNAPRITALSQHASQAQIMAAWQLAYEMEPYMLKSTHPIAVWELLLVRLCSTEKPELKVAEPSKRPASTLTKPAPVASQSPQIQQPPTGDELWSQVLSHMQQPASTRGPHGATLENSSNITHNKHGHTVKSTIMREETPTSRLVQRPVTPRDPAQHDAIVQQMLTLFPGTVTKDT